MRKEKSLDTGPPRALQGNPRRWPSGRALDSPSERVSLMAVALAGIERDADVLPGDWRTITRRVTRASIVAELETDRMYQTLTAQMLRLATVRARAADVRGIERLLTQVQWRDRELGTKRPEAVNALVAAVEAELDAARRLRLERDRWLLRLADFQSYQASIGTPVRRLDDTEARARGYQGARRIDAFRSRIGSAKRGAVFENDVRDRASRGVSSRP